VQPAPRRALIHTDAGTGNFIVGPQGIRLIDWQCPALGDAAEDLFAFLSPAFQVLYGHEPLTAEERAAFLAAYADPQVLARFVALEPALTYRFGAYCAMRRVALATSDPDGSARYARALALSIADLEAFR
jgi:aminoglycoside phosphotransferase (APT) family kinase protein